MQNVYDFDDTIFNGDSSVRFWRFCFKNDISLVRYIPKQLFGLLCYLLKLKNLTGCKEYFFSFLKGVKDPMRTVDAFCEQSKKRIKTWYLNQKSDNDIIITASPEFLVKGFFKDEHICVIGTTMDCETGKISGPNCKGEEKVKRLHELFPDVKIDSFYSDSHSDDPLGNISKNRYVGKFIKKWK